jgi:hypothetical protein
MHRFSSILLATGLFAASPLHAQQSPFLDGPVYDALVNEVSGDIAFEHIRWFTHYHRPMGGSEGFEAVARYVEEKARAYNLEDVRTIQLETRTPSWTASLGELWLTAPELRRLAFTPEVAISLADYSRSVDIPSAELVDVGNGTAGGDYADRAVAGKVVLASGPLARVMDEAVWKRGALGIVWFTESRRDHQDQVPWTRIPVRSEDDSKAGYVCLRALAARRPAAQARAGGSGRPLPGPRQGRIDDAAAWLAVHRRGRDPRHRDSRSRHRAHGASAGGTLLRERRRQRLRERPRDRARGEAHD